MVDVDLYVNLSAGENASLYYDKAKKIKKKIEGAKAALENSMRRLEELEKERQVEELEKEVTRKESGERAQKVSKKEWFEKFRWFFSSEGFLCIGGRDATTNEIIIKKHVDKDDIIFHTEMAGSPFFVVKVDGRKPGDATLRECAQATASYSRAWKLGLSAADTFYVGPSQVTKEAKAGEFIAKGAFMIYGRKNFVGAELKVAVGIRDGKVIGGPVDSIRKYAERCIIIVPGKDKASDIARRIKKDIGGDADDIIRFLPSGGLEIVR